MAEEIILYYRGCEIILEFNQSAKRIKLSLDDLLRPLSVTERAYFSDLHEYVIKKGMKLKIESETYFRYTYKKLYSLVLRTNPTRIIVPYTLKNIPDKFERFLEVAEKQPDADLLIKYIQDNIGVCDGCAANIASRERDKKKGIKKKCGYYWVNIREAKRLSCASSTINKYRYGKELVFNDEDIQMLKRMIDIRVMQIDNL